MIVFNRVSVKRVYYICVWLLIWFKFIVCLILVCCIYGYVY